MLHSRHETRIPALFWREGLAQPQILANILSGVHYAVALQRKYAQRSGIGHGMVVSHTPPDSRFSIDELRSIHYRVDRAIPRHTVWEESVCWMYNGHPMAWGSAVLTTIEGVVFLLSAYHVVFDKDDRLKTQHVRVDGKRLPLERAHLRVTDKANDFVIIDLPQLQGHTAIPMATQPPPVGTPVAIIGFPALREATPRKKLLFYTMGRVIGFRGATSQVAVDAISEPGYSGGAIVNLETGALIGITQSETSVPASSPVSFVLAPLFTLGLAPSMYLDTR